MRRLSLGFTWFLAALSVVFISGCGQETVTVPSVVSTSPEARAGGVAIDATVSATFNMAMNASSISGATFSVTGPRGAVAGTVSYSGSTATFTPAASLTYAIRYTATITTGARNLGGVSLQSNYVWTFTTIGPPPVAPVVTATTPGNGAINVPIGQVLSATFSEAMNAATIGSSTFELNGPGGTAVAGTVTSSGTVATFTPATELAYSTVYTATIRAGVSDVAGTPLATNYVWKFTTITPPPVVISTIPVNGSVDVPIGQVLSATFFEAMNPATVNNATFTVTGPGGTAVAGKVAYSGTVATFTPAADLAYGAVYTATITTGTADLAGTPLVAAYVWSFTTITPAPTVTSTIPATSATGVPIGQVLGAIFNQPMNCATLASPATTFTLTGPGGTAVAGSAGCSGDGATFMPETKLIVNTVYTATISTGAKDPAGTPLAANYVWTFRTLPAATAPTVISTVPVNLATDVPVNQALSATFSVAMNPATIDTTTFTVSGPGGAAVTGAVTYVPAGSVATFTPDAKLAADVVYTATIRTGATDLEGTALAQNYVWTFTTAVAVVVIPPTVTSTVPVDGATKVPIAQVVSATFSTAMDPATINSATFSLTGPGKTPVAGLVAYAAVGKTLTFTPTAVLVPSTLYTATITNGVKDLAGIEMVNNFVWTFTTGAAVVVTPPEVVSTVPANAATKVPLDAAVSATFSEAMNPLTLTTATFELTGPGGVAIAGTVAYDAIDFIATFTPTAPLKAGTTYTATVTDGATDLVGDPLGTTGAPNPWSFTTGAAIIPPPVVLGPTISLFGGFGGSAGMTNQGIDTVINGDIGTTAVSTTMTGFHDTSVVVGGVNECTYTETPLNIGLVNGSINTAPPPPTVGCPNEGTAVTFAVATKAAGEALAAYNTLAAIPNGIDVATLGGGAGELGNRTLAPGVYKSAPGSYAISMGDLTLDAKGDPNATWVFQMATTLTVGTPSGPESVLLVNGAQAANVYWQVGTAATLNGIVGGGTMQGTIISKAGISISTAGVKNITTLDGRALVLVGPVTMVNTVINVPAP